MSGCGPLILQTQLSLFFFHIVPSGNAFLGCKHFNAHKPHEDYQFFRSLGSSLSVLRQQERIAHRIIAIFVPLWSSSVSPARVCKQPKLRFHSAWGPIVKVIYFFCKCFFFHCVRTALSFKNRLYC